MGIFGEQIADDAIPEGKLDPAARAKLNSGGGGAPAPEDKTGDFAITSADDGKTFTNIGASGVVKGTADAGLPVGFSFSLMRVENFGLEFQPESGGRVATGVGAGDPWLPVDASVVIGVQVVTAQFQRTSSGWVVLPDASNVAQALVLLELNGAGLADVGAWGLDGLAFPNAAGNTPPWTITCKGVAPDGLETGTTFGTLSDSGAGPVYTPGAGGSSAPEIAIFIVSIPGGGAGPGGGLSTNDGVGGSDLSINVVSSPLVAAPPQLFQPHVPGSTQPVEITDGTGIYVDQNGGAWQASPAGIGAWTPPVLGSLIPGDPA